MHMNAHAKHRESESGANWKSESLFKPANNAQMHIEDIPKGKRENIAIKLGLKSLVIFMV